MWKKVVIASAVGAAIIGSGGAALAASTTSTPTAPSTPAASGSASTTHSGTAKAGKHHRDPLTRALHAQWVTHDKKTNTNVTHDEIRGSVTAVSATSISIKASDGVSQTYAASTATKVHAKGDTKAAPGTISQVKVGDQAAVIGTGTSSLTATHIDDHGVAKTPTTPKATATS